MTITRTQRAVLAACTASLAGVLTAAAAANAATIAALQNGDTITWIDADKKKVTGKAKLAGGAKLVGVDVRPADGQLYGVTADGSIVTVDPMTGKWAKKSQLSEKLPANAVISVDFNPAADRLRIIASNGLSLRVNVDDGKAIVDGALKHAEGDAGIGKPSMVAAVAYSDSVAGTKTTTLYDIDAKAGTLLRQAPPNDGILNTIGALGVKLGGPVAFDIASDGNGGNWAWLLSGGKLHSVDMKTGKASAAGAVAGLKGPVSDMAILPAK